MNIKLIESRADIIYESISDIIDGRLGDYRPTSPDYLDGLIYGYSILNRSISRVCRTFSSQRTNLEVDPSSVEAVIEDLVGVYGVYLPGGEQLLDDEILLIEDLNNQIAEYLR
jgi:hypothetical protein